MNKIKITNEKLEELKRLAEAATPGPWEALTNGVCLPEHNNRQEVLGSFYDNNNTNFVAAASPDFIMALIEDDMQLLRENRRFSNEITKLNKMVDWFAARMPLSEHDDTRQEGIDRWKRKARNETR